MFCSSCGIRLDAAPPTRCASCGTEHWNDAKPCASALVMHESRLLLVKRAEEPWRGLWDVPGGFCDPGEHPAETAEREILEEVGVRVEVTGFLGMWLDDYGDARRTLNIYYHARPRPPVEVAVHSGEILDVGWFLPSELPDALAFPAHVPAALAAWKTAVREGRLNGGLPDRPAGSARTAHDHE